MMMSSSRSTETKQIAPCDRSVFRARVRSGVLALLLGVASSAHASNEAGLARLDGLAYAGPVLIGASLFITMDIVYGAHGRLLPPGWAIAQLIIPTPMLFVSAVVLEGRGDQEKIDQLRVAAAVTGAWFLGHGIWSLVVYSDEHAADPDASTTTREPTKTRAPPARPTRVMKLDVAPTLGGGMLLCSARL